MKLTFSITSFVLNLVVLISPKVQFTSLANDRSPVLPPVNVPLANLIASVLSSYPMNMLGSSPRSIMIPASPVAEPVLPVPSSNNLSEIVVLVVETVVVVPLTVRLPVTVRLLQTVISLGSPTVSV